jgi:hypothetical protein
VPHPPAPTRFGRVHVAEPLSSIFRLHRHDQAVQLRAVAHPPAIPVLDQEDLTAQGIDTSRVIPGAPRVDALGSCVANATAAALSVILPPDGLAAALPGAQLDHSAVQDEVTAIRLYHAFTDLTGQPSEEWPPADCGSSGLYACQWLEAHRVTAGHLIAQGADSIISLMQDHALITGQPWLNAWMTPAADGLIDRDGSGQALQEDLAGGIAGGHETCWYGIESLALGEDGHVDPAHTIIRFRNSWSESWGLAGDGLAHLSTFIFLARWCDHRALLASPSAALAAELERRLDTGLRPVAQVRAELGLLPFDLPETGVVAS